MQPNDSEQYSTPQDQPKGSDKAPRQPGDEREKDIRKGATNEDQRETLKPSEDADKAPNEIGAPPASNADGGNKGNQ